MHFLNFYNKWRIFRFIERILNKKHEYGKGFEKKYKKAKYNSQVS